VAPLLIAAGLFLLLRRELGTIARRWRVAGRWRRRAARAALRTRTELREVARRPLAVAAAAVCSLTTWVAIWGVTAILLSGMGVRWPVGTVLAGVLGAAAGVALPFNAGANFGSLEGGWAVALAIAGVPPSESLAAGFATHSWSLAFNLALGLGGGAFLLLSQPGSPDSSTRDARRNSRTSSAEP
ncbi:MAG: lysylphosphatidylglycerol synthase domain-containing protein, partial [Acidobacteriota bacterium]